MMQKGLNDVGYLSVFRQASSRQSLPSHKIPSSITSLSSSAIAFFSRYNRVNNGTYSRIHSHSGLVSSRQCNYHVTLHPLANIPGPKICGITRIPYWLASLKGEDVKWMKGLHDRYGPVVRFGPTDVSYTASEAWNDIHGPKITEKAQEFSVQPVNGKQLIWR
jgi:hypothetical protein